MDHHHHPRFLFPNAQLYLYLSQYSSNSSLHHHHQNQNQEEEHHHHHHRSLIHHGDFSIRCFVSPFASTSPTFFMSSAVIMAAVGDFHWPLSLDVHVLRQTSTSFCFFLPGSSSPAYAVVFASPPPDLPAFESFLQTYSRYQAYGDNMPACAELPCPGPAPAAAASSDLLDRCSAPRPVSKLDRYYSPPARSRSASSSCGSSCSAMEALASLQTARMMSAVVKLLSRSLERGVIRAEAHTLDFDPRASTRAALMENSRPTVVVQRPFAVESMPDHEKCGSAGGDERLLVVASVDAVNKVMRAVRNGSGLADDEVLIFGCAYDHTAPEAAAADHEAVVEKDGNIMNGGDRRRRRCWTLNRKGVEVMVTMIRALMRIHNNNKGSSMNYMKVEGMAAAAAASSGVGRRRSTGAGAATTYSDHHDGCFGESAGRLPSTAASCSSGALPPRPRRRRPTALRYHHGSRQPLDLGLMVAVQHGHGQARKD